MDETKLLRIVVLSLLCQTTLARPFSFPDGTRTGGGDQRNRDAQSRSSQQLEEEPPEGRSIRGGGYNQLNRPDYSRYSVYEHEDDFDYRRSTTTTTTTPRSTGTTRQTYNTATYTPIPNALFNRLPPSRNDEPIEAEPEEDDDYSDEISDVEVTTRKPLTQADYSSSYYGVKPGTINNVFYSGNNKYGGFGDFFGDLFGQNRNKHKYKHKFKRRKPGQPCIPYDLFNRLRSGRDSNGNPIDPKTLLPLNLILADVNYYSPNNLYGGGGSAGGGSYHDTGSAPVFNNHFYDAVGGYPCVGVGAGGVRPQRPGGGPLGFFGQGGLFDWNWSSQSSSSPVQSDPGVGDVPNNRPQVALNLNDALNTVASSWMPGTGIQMILQSVAGIVEAAAGGVASPVAAVGDAVDTVRQVNREFISLFT